MGDRTTADLTEAQTTFLRERPHAIVATLMKDGRPQLTPNWYLWDGERFWVSTLDWTVKMDGLVKDVRVASSTLSNPKVAVCVVDAVKGWKFPKPVGGEALISYPFLFRSSG